MLSPNHMLVWLCHVILSHALHSKRSIQSGTCWVLIASNWLSTRVREPPLLCSIIITRESRFTSRLDRSTGLLCVLKCNCLFVLHLRWKNRSSSGRCQPGFQVAGGELEWTGGLCPQPGACGLRPSNADLSCQQEQCVAVSPAWSPRYRGKERLHSGLHAAPGLPTRRSVWNTHTYNLYNCMCVCMQCFPQDELSFSLACLILFTVCRVYM